MSEAIRATAIVLDLDGPILECRHRHFSCYRDLCLRHGVRALSEDEYWNLKRRRAGAAAIFGRSGARGGETDLQRAWVAQVEEPGYLTLDEVQPGAREVLASWSASGVPLFLATLRRDPDALREQLEALDLTRFFAAIVVSDPRLGGEGKARAVAQSAPGIELRRAIWIGDTEVDARAAATLRCALFLLTCGIRDEEHLRSLEAGEVLCDLVAVRERIGAGSIAARGGIHVP